MIKLFEKLYKVKINLELLSENLFTLSTVTPRFSTTKNDEITNFDLFLDGEVHDRGKAYLSLVQAYQHRFP